MLILTKTPYYFELESDQVFCHLHANIKTLMDDFDLSNSDTEWHLMTTFVIRILYLLPYSVIIWARLVSTCIFLLLHRS